MVVKRARNLFGTTAPVPTLVEATLAHQNGASAVAGDGEGAANVPGLFRNVLGQNTRALRNPTYADADFTFDAFQPWAGASLLIELRGSAANNGAPRAFAGRLRIPVDRVASVGEGDEPPPPSWCRLTDRPPGEKDAGVAWAETIGAKAVEGAESSQELPDSAVTVRVFCDDNDRHRVYVAVERSQILFLHHATALPRAGNMCKNVNKDPAYCGMRKAFSWLPSKPPSAARPAPSWTCTTRPRPMVRATLSGGSRWSSERMSTMRSSGDIVSSAARTAVSTWSFASSELVTWLIVTVASTAACARSTSQG